MWKIGKPAPFAFSHRLWERIWYFIKNGVFHGAIQRRRESYPGLMHLLIFWGFLLLFIGSGLIAFQDDFLRLLFGVTCFSTAAST